MSLRVPMTQMLQALERFSHSRAIEASQDETPLVDAPTGTWSKTFRLAAAKYFGQKLEYVTSEDDEGNLYLAMREDHSSLEKAQCLGRS